MRNSNCRRALPDSASYLRGMIACLALVLVTGGAHVAAAQDRDAEFEALAEALRISDTVAIMREEGLLYADQVADAMLPEVDTAGWQQQVAQLYDASRMEQLVLQGLERALEGADLAPMLAFYTNDTGERAVALELEARRSFLDPEAEDSARAAAADAMARDDGPQADLLDWVRRMIEGSDLIERNVTASLNADMMFWRGVMDGGGPGPAGDAGSEADLADAVTADLEATRRDTEAWLTAFLMVAGDPLTPGQMDAYATFYETRDGRILNAALFEGFNAMYDQLAYLLGRTVGTWMTSAPL
ncbi:MAG TPA: DUF2059 domain-containing protein [Roseovarius sp.]